MEDSGREAGRVKLRVFPGICQKVTRRDLRIRGRRATWDPQRTDCTVGHGDRRARALFHQVHDLPEEFARVGGTGAVKLVVLRGNDGGGGQDRQSHEGDGGGGARHGCGLEVDEVGDVVIRYDRSLGLFLVWEARGEK